MANKTRKSFSKCSVFGIFRLLFSLAWFSEQCKLSTAHLLSNTILHENTYVQFNDFSSFNSITTTVVTPIPIESSCKAFIDEYAGFAAGFTKCSIENARPLRFCEKCVKDYALAKSAYKVIMTGLAKDEKGNMCGQYILNADKIQLISQTEIFIEKVWSDGHCESCFDHYSIKNDTVDYSLKKDITKFQSLANDTWDCFINNSNASIRPFGPSNITRNNTVCNNCASLYKEINSYYVKLEDVYANGVCMDVVDMMNYTRMLWSGDFNCTRPKGDIVAVTILSAIFCSLPVIFYVAAKIYGTKQEHRIIEQNRYRSNQNQDRSNTLRS